MLNKMNNNSTDDNDNDNTSNSNSTEMEKFSIARRNVKDKDTEQENLLFVLLNVFQYCFSQTLRGCLFVHLFAPAIHGKILLWPFFEFT